MQPGDVITALNGRAVYTFGDLQHWYDKVPRPDTESIQLTVQRGEATEDLTIALPKEWWWTDIYYRFFTIDPEYYFFTELLTADEKEAWACPKMASPARILTSTPPPKSSHPYASERRHHHRRRRRSIRPVHRQRRNLHQTKRNRRRKRDTYHNTRRGNAGSTLEAAPAILPKTRDQKRVGLKI